MQAETLVGVNLEGQELHRAILDGADMHGASLRRSNLRGAILDGANLSGADIREAALMVASLRGADLSFARLIGTSVVGARFDQADLRQANLAQADVAGAVFAGADLRGACMQCERLEGADLSGAFFDETTQWPPGFSPQSKGALQRQKGRMLMVSSSEERRYLAEARLPSNSGRKSVQLRLREICEQKELDSVLLVEVVAKGEMLERGKRDLGEFVTDFELVFPQVLVSAKALRALRDLIKGALELERIESMEPFEVHLGGFDCILDIGLGHQSAVLGRSDLPACSVVCEVGGRAECLFAVDPSCLVEFVEGLEHMLALVP